MFKVNLYLRRTRGAETTSILRRKSLLWEINFKLLSRLMKHCKKVSRTKNVQTWVVQTKNCQERMNLFIKNKYWKLCRRTRSKGPLIWRHLSRSRLLRMITTSLNISNCKQNKRFKLTRLRSPTCLSRTRKFRSSRRSFRLKETGFSIIKSKFNHWLKKISNWFKTKLLRYLESRTKKLIGWRKS